MHRVPRKRPQIRGKLCDCGQPAVLETSGRQRWCQGCLDKVPIVHSLHYPDAQERPEEIVNRKYLQEYTLEIPSTVDL